jgi:hypothetical protein
MAAYDILEEDTGHQLQAGLFGTPQARTGRPCASPTCSCSYPSTPARVSKDISVTGNHDSPDDEQTYVYVPDGTNMKVWILTRSDLEVVGSFGVGGRLAGYFE